MLDKSRYVLIHVLPDGTPNAVQPVSTLAEARRKLKALTERGESGWHIFDLDENRGWNSGIAASDERTVEGRRQGARKEPIDAPPDG